MPNIPTARCHKCNRVIVGILPVTNARTPVVDKDFDLWILAYCKEHKRKALKKFQKRIVRYLEKHKI